MTIIFGFFSRLAEPLSQLCKACKLFAFCISWISKFSRTKVLIQVHNQIIQCSFFKQVNINLWWLPMRFTGIDFKLKCKLDNGKMAPVMSNMLFLKSNWTRPTSKLVQNSRISPRNLLTVATWEEKSLELRSGMSSWVSGVRILRRTRVSVITDVGGHWVYHLLLIGHILPHNEDYLCVYK